MALLQSGTICLVSLVKEIQNNPIRTKGGVVFQREMEFLEFQEEIRNSSFVTGWRYMTSLSGLKKFRMIE